MGDNRAERLRALVNKIGNPTLSARQDWMAQQEQRQRFPSGDYDQVVADRQWASQAQEDEQMGDGRPQRDPNTGRFISQEEFQNRVQGLRNMLRERNSPIYNQVFGGGGDDGQSIPEAQEDEPTQDPGPAE